MTRAPLPERSLAAVHPEVAAQLHPTRNSPVTADSVSAGSTARLWWQCPDGHEWETSAKARTRGTGCPYCAGKLPTPTTCLAAVDPVLAGQWHPRRNGTLTPADVLPSSNRRVWWQCSWGHAWAAPVDRRTRGSGCPDCPRRLAAPTLVDGYPDLAAQWDTTTNGELTDAVTAGSNRRVGWRCEHGHTWTAAVYSRTAGTGCPYCAGKLPTPATCLAARYPDLAAQWDPDRNGTLDPTAVLPNSNRRVWWRCSTDADHVWAAAVHSRTGQGVGCPFCAGQRVTSATSLAAVHPEVAADWDPARNGTRTPDTVTAHTGATAWWRCPAGHHWEAQITSRTTGGTGCPYCAGQRATPATSLAAVDPDLAAQWDPDRNGDLEPTAVRPYSPLHVWWQCPAGHHWQAKIKERSRRHTGCPVCAPRGRHGRLLTTTRPDLAEQWSELLNAGGPGTITTGSLVKAWWVCTTDPTHLWRTNVVHRVRAHIGCPYCTHQLPTAATCLAAAAPHLVGDWHPTRNGDLSPTDVLPHSKTPVWWQCREHHEWATAPDTRFTGRGCPDCAAAARPRVRRPPAVTTVGTA